MRFRFTHHAIMEMARRGISENDVNAVMESPGQILAVRNGRCVYQSRIESGAILRVIGDVDRDPAEVVTAYRSSKIAKYWRSHP
jgi:hypothetical protein